ncbi:MAG TPA: hypothetical protein VM532_11930 [Burkholderiales bacterium]|jgi:hypothetical protein|nr:hypothetical protein [Burkholderiales bacterium]
MNRFRNLQKGAVVVLAVWLAIIGHIAAAMPFCDQTQAPAVAQLSESRQQSILAVEQGGDHCAQSGEQGKGDGNNPKLSCEACGMCHMACHALPPVMSGVKAGMPNRVYSNTIVATLISFIPEQPQHVPLNLLA